MPIRAARSAPETDLIDLCPLLHHQHEWVLASGQHHRDVVELVAELSDMLRG
jgi:hypothetical protein